MFRYKNTFKSSEPVAVKSVQNRRHLNSPESTFHNRLFRTVWQMGPNRCPYVIFYLKYLILGNGNQLTCFTFLLHYLVLST